MLIFETNSFFVRKETTYPIKIIMTFLVVFLSMFNPAFSQTFQVDNVDTINIVDVNNMKQGHWIYFGSMKALPGFTPEAKVEEGEFANNRKSGIWIKYYPDGTPHSEITFANNRPNGPYKTYYKNGELEEKGIWKNNRNIQEFERHYENGKLQQKFEFNPTGKRDGVQTYFYENGEKMIEGVFTAGKEDGLITEWFADGSIKSEKFYNGGMIDATQTKKYEPASEIKEVVPAVKTKQADVLEEEDIVELEKPVKKAGAKLGFTGEGNHTLYNRDRQITQKGFFKGGRLYEGKWYRYDENGILQSIEIYKKGHYVGDGVIEE